MHGLNRKVGVIALLKGTPYKWLDLGSFVKWFLRPDQEIVGIKYFTAPIKTYPHDGDAVDRQKVYLQALSSMPLVTIVQGFYAKNKTLAPVVEKRCRTCDVVVNGYVPVVKLEENRSDVNFSVAVMLDAFRTRKLAYARHEKTRKEQRRR